MGKEEEEQQQHPQSGVSYRAAVAAKNLVRYSPNAKKRDSVKT